MVSNRPQKQITSLQHPLVKHLVKLRERRDYRQECGTALISGDKLIRELAARFPFKTVFMQKGFEPGFALRAESSFEVTAEILKKVTGLKSPEALAVEIELPPQADLRQVEYLLILDGVSDPGNLGTLLRTALALGWQGVLLTPQSTDPFNERALRAAKGATFKLPIQVASWEEVEALLQCKQWNFLAADSRGDDLKSVQADSPVALALGNEAQGLSPLTRRLARCVAIPMASAMESLNVAVAGAILMHAFKRSK